MVYFWFAVLTFIATIVWVWCRHETIYDKRRSGYIIVNRMMGNPCFEGRIFYTARGAERYLRRRLKRDKTSALLFIFGDVAAYDIRKVL